MVQIGKKMEDKKYKLASQKGAQARKNLDMLCNFKVIFSILAMMPTLSIVHDLVVFV
jgi:hypothetical protein